MPRRLIQRRKRGSYLDGKSSRRETRRKKRRSQNLSRLALRLRQSFDRERAQSPVLHPLESAVRGARSLFCHRRMSADHRHRKHGVIRNLRNCLGRAPSSFSFGVCELPIALPRRAIEPCVRGDYFIDTVATVHTVDRREPRGDPIWSTI